MSPGPRLLVTGNGLLARALVAAAERRGQEAAVASRGVADGVCSARADLTVPDNALERAVHRFEPDVVIHTAAETSVARCEADPGAAYAANVAATERVMRAAGAGAAVLALSTDWVFDGSAAPYSEEDPLAPLNVYGRTKAWAEEAVLAAGGAVVRGTFLGRRPDGRAGLVERLLDADTVPQVPALRRGRPLWVGTAAEALLDLSTLRVDGVWHLGSRDSVDWPDLARMVRAGAGLGDVEAVDPVDGLARPRDTSLVVAKVEATLGRAMPSTSATVADLLAAPPLGVEVAA